VKRCSSSWRAAAVWLLMAAGAATVTGQQAFRGGTELVGLTITVLDGNNRLVAGLDEEDFQVFEDNVRQDISNFSRQPQPTALSLVIDTSVSMEPRLTVAQGAAIGFVRRMGANDLTQVLRQHHEDPDRIHPGQGRAGARDPPHGSERIDVTV
jgi:hypothetical protein